jgi:hypothetical protein
MAWLFAGSAGTWPTGGYANLVPLVANGRVFVGSYRQLVILGTKNGTTAQVPVGADQKWTNREAVDASATITSGIEPPAHQEIGPEHARSRWII